MIRFIVTPEESTIAFAIPKDYVGKQITVIAFAIDEVKEYEAPVQKKVSFNAPHVDTRDYKINRDEANER